MCYSDALILSISKCRPVGGAGTIRFSKTYTYVYTNHANIHMWSKFRKPDIIAQYKIPSIKHCKISGFHKKLAVSLWGHKTTMVAPIWHRCTPCHTRSKYISEALLYFNVFKQHEAFLQVVENDDYCAALQQDFS